MLNLYPYNNGHLMIAPYRHIANLTQFTAAEWTELHDMAKASIKRLTRLVQPDGFNVGFNIGKAAGAGYAGHLHLHVVPRWEGDTNFMPVLTQDKVISESLESMRQRLADG